MKKFLVLLWLMPWCFAAWAQLSLQGEALLHESEKVGTNLVDFALSWRGQSGTGMSPAAYRPVSEKMSPKPVPGDKLQGERELQSSETPVAVARGIHVRESLASLSHGTLGTSGRTAGMTKTGVSAVSKAEGDVSTFVGWECLDNELVRFRLEGREVGELESLDSPFSGWLISDPSVAYPLFPYWSVWMGDRLAGIWGFQLGSTNYYSGYCWFDPASGDAGQYRYRNEDFDPLVGSTKAAYDAGSGRLYVVSDLYGEEGYAASDLYVVEFAGDSLYISGTIRMDAPQSVVMACDSEGSLYVIAVDGNLYSVDKETGKSFLVGSTGKQIVSSTGNWFRQSATFDSRTGKLYWFYAAIDDTDNPYFGLATVDTETAALEEIASLDDRQMGSVVVLDYEEPVPMPASSLLVDYVERPTGEVCWDFHWETPSYDVNGDAFSTSLTALFYRGTPAEGMPSGYTEYRLLDFKEGVEPGRPYSFSFAGGEPSWGDSLYICFQDEVGRYSAFTKGERIPSVATLPYSNDFESDELEAMGALHFHNPKGTASGGWDKHSYDGFYSYKIDGDYGQDSCMLELSFFVGEAEEFTDWSFFCYVQAESESEDNSVTILLNGNRKYSASNLPSPQDASWVGPGFRMASEELQTGTNLLQIVPRGSVPIYIDGINLSRFGDVRAPDQTLIRRVESLPGDTPVARLHLELPETSYTGGELVGITELYIEYYNLNSGGREVYDTLLQGTWEPGSEITVEIPAIPGWLYFNVQAGNEFGMCPYRMGIYTYFGSRLVWEGIVTDEAGDPLSGVLVEADFASGLYSGYTSFGKSSCTTGADGKYRLEVPSLMAGAEYYGSTMLYAWVEASKFGWESSGVYVPLGANDSILEPMVLSHEARPVLAAKAVLDAGQSVEVSWQKPALEGRLSYAAEGNLSYYRLGIGGWWTEEGWVQPAFRYAQRFLPEDLDALGLESPMPWRIGFVPGSDQVDYSLLVCQDSQTLYRVEVDREDLEVGAWYFDTISAEIALDPEKELWVMVEVAEKYSEYELRDYPCAVTTTGGQSGKGNLICIGVGPDGEEIWDPLENLFSHPYAEGNVLVSLDVVDEKAGEAPRNGYRVYRWSDTAECLTPEPVQDTLFRDTGYGELADGLYRYAVLADWGGKLSEAVYTDTLRKESPRPAPVSLRVEVEGFAAELSWEAAPGSSPLSYELYLDEELVDTAWMETRYRFEDLAVGEHEAGVVAVYGNGKSERESIRFVVEDLSNEVAWAEVEVYPNPNQGRFWIRLPFACRMELYTASGQRVAACDLNAGLHELRPGLAGGLYFLRLEKGKDARYYKLVVR